MMRGMLGVGMNNLFLAFSLSKGLFTPSCIDWVYLAKAFSEEI